MFNLNGMYDDEGPILCRHNIVMTKGAQGKACGLIVYAWDCPECAHVMALQDNEESNQRVAEDKEIIAAEEELLLHPPTEAEKSLYLVYKQEQARYCLSEDDPDFPRELNWEYTKGLNAISFVRVAGRKF